MSEPIFISNIASVSALGNNPDEVWNSYLKAKPLFSKTSVNGCDCWVSEISTSVKSDLELLTQSNPNYGKLDRSVQLAITAARLVMDRNELNDNRVGINIGSSRGATQLFEEFHEDYLKEGRVSAYTSPTTTLGNISSWVGQDLEIGGIQMGHSVTCSTAMHAVLNGIAWLRSNMSDMFLVGGSEVPTTPFTIAQMKALKLYSKLEREQACESMKFDKSSNTMVLSEASAMAVLEKGIHKHSRAVIRGIGFSSEILEHGSSISENADCFQKSMKMALKDAKLTTVDGIVMHAPGTVKGDVAEMNAIEIVFVNDTPLLTSNKWMIGHSLGASGMMSLEMAVLMLKHNRWIGNPFHKNSKQEINHLETVLVNAVGFGGNAVSIIISKP
ncbi:MAG: beta-ketoacyl synthase [Flavobacteriaceae bacterium]|nr:beta-ketoacyl synthase [Flavobacteriaceae bacterium]